VSGVWRVTGVSGERFLLAGVVVRQTESKDLLLAREATDSAESAPKTRPNVSIHFRELRQPYFASGDVPMGRAGYGPCVLTSETSSNSNAGETVDATET